MAQRIEFLGEVGGDYYDYMPFGDGRWAIVCGDVMGKGLSAALIMAMARSLLHDAVAPGKQPAEVLREVNDGLAARPEGQRMPTFLTLAIVAFDPATARLRRRRRRPQPRARAARRRDAPAARRRAPALGVRTGLTFAQRRFQLRPPANVSRLFTDGLTEARAPDGELFGLDRLADVLDASTRRAARRRHSEPTWREVIALPQSGGQPADDATLLIMEAS